MGIYSFRNKLTNEELTLTLSMSERESYLAQNSDMEQMIVSAPAIGDSVRLGLRKPDNGWRDMLKTVSKGSPHNKINIR